MNEKERADLESFIDTIRERAQDWNRNIKVDPWEWGNKVPIYCQGRSDGFAFVVDRLEKLFLQGRKRYG